MTSNLCGALRLAGCCLAAPLASLRQACRLRRLEHPRRLYMIWSNHWSVQPSCQLFLHPPRTIVTQSVFRGKGTSMKETIASKFRQCPAQCCGSSTRKQKSGRRTTGYPPSCEWCSRQSGFCCLSALRFAQSISRWLTERRRKILSCHGHAYCQACIHMSVGVTACKISDLGRSCANNLNGFSGRSRLITADHN